MIAPSTECINIENNLGALLFPEGIELVQGQTENGQEDLKIRPVTPGTGSLSRIGLHRHMKME
jgi:hypothetical protein